MRTYFLCGSKVLTFFSEEAVSVLAILRALPRLKLAPGAKAAAGAKRRKAEESFILVVTILTTKEKVWWLSKVFCF
jgi:hypothetical protein